MQNRIAEVPVVAVAAVEAGETVAPVYGSLDDSRRKGEWVQSGMWMRTSTKWSTTDFLAVFVSWAGELLSGNDGDTKESVGAFGKQVLRTTLQNYGLQNISLASVALEHGRTYWISEIKSLRLDRPIPTRLELVICV